MTTKKPEGDELARGGGIGTGCKQRWAGRTYAWRLTGQMKKPKGSPEAELRGRDKVGRWAMIVPTNGWHVVDHKEYRAQ